MIIIVVWEEYQQIKNRRKSMSHFSVAVFTDGEMTVDELLAPFDENIEVPVYVSETREEAIEVVRKNIAREAEWYREWKSNPIEYESRYPDKDYLDYIKNELPKKFHWSDEECYQDYVKDYEKEDIDDDGSILSTYNSQGKWDYYCIGGRWNDLLASKKENEEILNSSERNGKIEQYKCNEAYIGDVLFPENFETFAVVWPDGSWYEKGKMGWWAIVQNEDTKWQEMYKERFLDKADPRWKVSIVDCHI